MSTCRFSHKQRRQRENEISLFCKGKNILITCSLTSRIQIAKVSRSLATFGGKYLVMVVLVINSNYKIYTTVLSSEIAINDSKIHRLNRSYKKGWDIGAYFNKSIKSAVITELSFRVRLSSTCTSSWEWSLWYISQWSSTSISSSQNKNYKDTYPLYQLKKL